MANGWNHTGHRLANLQFSEPPPDPYFLEGHVTLGFDAEHWHGRFIAETGQVELQATPEEWAAWSRTLSAAIAAAQDQH